MLCLGTPYLVSSGRFFFSITAYSVIKKRLSVIRSGFHGVSCSIICCWDQFFYGFEKRTIRRVSAHFPAVPSKTEVFLPPLQCHVMLLLLLHPPICPYLRPRPLSCPSLNTRGLAPLPLHNPVTPSPTVLHALIFFFLPAASNYPPRPPLCLNHPRRKVLEEGNQLGWDSAGGWRVNVTLWR